MTIEYSAYRASFRPNITFKSADHPTVTSDEDELTRIRLPLAREEALLRVSGWLKRWRPEVRRQFEEDEQELDELAMAIHGKKADIQVLKARLDHPIPDPNLCPECWFRHGNRVALLAISSPRLSNRVLRECPHCRYREV